jgi:perosamine synthetase
VTDTALEPIPLSRPAVGPREERLVLEVLRSGRLSLGQKLGEFEAGFAQRLGANYCCAVSSGTAGLHLALRAAGVGPGDEVLTTPLSFVASANAIVYEGARPVFCDIEPDTLNLDPDAAEAAHTERTTGLLPVHIFGYPAQMPKFEEFARREGLWLVEDACEALGAWHADGLAVGARGNLSVFAFYANKQLTTGEGGMVICPDTSSRAMIASERNQGRTDDMNWLDHTRLGYNYRLSELACALGVAQLESLDSLLVRRQRVAELYGQALSGIEGLSLPLADRAGNKRGWFVYVVQLPPHADRDTVIARLADAGIGSKPYLPAIHLMTYYRQRFGYRPGQFPVCEDIARRSVALPFYPDLGETQIQRVSEAVADAVAQSPR